MDDIRSRAESWIEGDVDEEMQALLISALQDEERLNSLIGEPLSFGTAGIRGEVGPGPSRMNRALVIKTTWALAQHLHEQSLSGPVVVGFDARPTSRQFAIDTVGVLAAAGIDVRFFFHPTPTPIVAYAAKILGAISAVVVTASHNPPQDNGYKVYGVNASQIVSPTDESIQSLMVSSPPACDIPRLEDSFSVLDDRVLGLEILDEYWTEVSTGRTRHTGSDLDIVYTPLHGVGYDAFQYVMDRAGHSSLTSVKQQVEPDGTFPTVSFPNPEEPGALDMAIATADEVNADLILANDPDADRLAVVVPSAQGWRPLTGNEIGVLLGDYLLRNRSSNAKGVVASSIVSSPMMGLVASSYGAHFERTLTGFKWITMAGMDLADSSDSEFVFGYEEALGYCVRDVVRDKDGLSAGLMFADLVADLADVGQSVLDRLEELWADHGLWVSTQVSIKRPGEQGASSLRSAVEQLAVDPPTTLAGLRVDSVTDYRHGGDRRPPWLGNQDLVELSFGEYGRALARPSGTEPKLKVYVDLCEPLRPGQTTEQHTALKDRASMVGRSLADSFDV